MPSIDLRQSHQLPLAEARARVEHVADRMREKFAMDSRWDGDTLRFSRSGVNPVLIAAWRSAGNVRHHSSVSRAVSSVGRKVSPALISGVRSKRANPAVRPRIT